jgi:hypothetical protein
VPNPEYIIVKKCNCQSTNARIVPLRYVASVLLFTAIAAHARVDADELIKKDQAFQKWVALATAYPTSPVVAEAGDQSITWVAPNKQDVHIVVKIPHPSKSAPTITLDNVPSGVDARPYFETALARVKAQKAGQLVIPRGTYTFSSLNSDKLGHLVIRDLSDVTIDGGGSTFVFTQNSPGIYLTSNRRLKLTRLKIEYSLRMASLGQIRATPAGNQLVIDPQYPVTASDAITYLTEYDTATKNWVKPPQRVIITPGSSTPAVFIGGQTFTSASFKQVTPGKTFVAFHQWYGGVAIEVSDIAGTTTSQDLTLDDITIRSGPGMGILAYGMERGLAIINSTIAPKVDPLSLISTEYDAIHILIAGGDVIIADNKISGQGDDGINFSAAMHPVVSSSSNGIDVVLSAYSRFIRTGDTLAFFNASGDFIGKSEVASMKSLGGINNAITLTDAITGLTSTSVARDLRLSNSRYAIQRNTISNCHCHGVLLEAPYGLVTDNTISGIAYNAIRLVTFVGSFNEGLGAFDVDVSGNTIADTGPDSSMKLPWGAITAYGVTPNNVVATFPVNGDITISKNRISDVAQGCITVLSSRRATIGENTCDGSNSTNANPAISVADASSVVIKENRLTGTFAGKIDIDHSTTNDVKAGAN